ncbi:alanine--tRNA ligase [Ginsengibacter hankyongi]|uniref:Alanine--tRNA ligase n=2 Tax=Ginsengibacter hankyongi TaxID=2607284 RepID=A0A5J5IMT2_9BACT|nr:alanine--tRNA ligase [Ginsengibacter hankyongi]
MQSAEIRQHFFDFFKSKGHTIVPSAPIVIKDDPTLLFTNAGMNQFKDYFLGNKKPSYTRVADTQKCLRVSGKHNDLEEVGVDTYHHTMFEMLGNWSFGNSTENPAPYFKEEAIAWAWELLTEVYKIDKQRLYVTVFEGDAKEGLPKDEEAISFWKKWIAEDRIIMGKKKDNFWEMGDSGPCGPCTEIHIDSRTDEERKKTDGKSLVNNDHPQVIEIWNVVFIQYNRRKDGSLEPLPAKHVDTGMGFERLVRVIQNKQSNYDTDIFSGTIEAIEHITNKPYQSYLQEGIAFRVIADHIRAISFTIADGQLPSNIGAGYVIRRILRRAVRYYYSFFYYREPLLYQLVPVIAKEFKNVFPELFKQQDFVARVIKEEEDAFLRTLDKGLKRLDEQFKKERDSLIVKIEQGIIEKSSSYNIILDGKLLFELFDTYGFPLDLTKLIASETKFGGIGFSVDEVGFNTEMLQQKTRSRAASVVDTEDWIILSNAEGSKFVGYDTYETKGKVLKYRKTKSQGKELYQIVLDKTPFYAESGGQVGDTGVLIFDDEKIPVVNTKKENDLIIHFTNELPANIDTKVIAKIDVDKRKKTAVHHSATHLMHAALRKVLGNHVAQKGSLVNHEYLRFDFSHFAKVTDEEIRKVESLVNEKVRLNVPVIVQQMPKQEALKTGAMALFGEKYGDTVRVVKMDADYSIELCGGTHVGNTGELGFFKIIAETAVGAGIRRIEALSGKAAEDYIQKEFTAMHHIRESLKNPKDINKAVENFITENNELKKQLEKLEAKQLSSIKNDLLQKVEKIKDINFIGQLVDVPNADALKKICFSLKTELKNYVIVLAAVIDGKPNVAVMLDDTVAASKNLEAPKIIKEYIAPLIKGGGGGQKTLATAGGQDASKLNDVIEKVKSLL